MWNEPRAQACSVKNVLTRQKNLHINYNDSKYNNIRMVIMIILLINNNNSYKNSVIDSQDYYLYQVSGQRQGKHREHLVKNLCPCLSIFAQ